MHVWGSCILVAFLNVAMISDLLTGKIRNGMIAAGLVLGFLFQVMENGAWSVWGFAGGVMLSFIGTFPLFVFRAVGAGDVKLLMVTGGFLGPGVMPVCLLVTLLLSAGAAFVKMLFQGTLFYRLTYFGCYVKSCVEEKRLKPYEQSWKEDKAVIHLSAPILFSVLCCMLGGLY